MTHVDLRTLRLAPGDHRRLKVPVTIAPFTAGAQEYRAEPPRGAGAARPHAARGRAALRPRLRRHRSSGRASAASRMRASELEVSAREYQADVPEVEDEETTPYLAGRAARRRPLGDRQRHPRAADRDPLPRRLRGPLPAVRRRPQRRRLRLRAAQGRALGAPARAVVAAHRHVRYASAQYAGPQEEDLEIPPRQAPLPGRAPGDRRRSSARSAARRRAHIGCAPRARRTRGARSSRSRREHRGHRRA